MRIGKWNTLGLGCLLAAGMANAHLMADGLKPGAGETLKKGDTYTITFKEQVNHGKNADIALSIDGGTTWSDIKTGFGDQQGENSFKWTVAGATTINAKIRICQKDPNGCTNADNVSDINGTKGGGHYILVSPAFTIAEAGSGVLAASSAQPFSIDYHPSTRNVDVSFGLSEAREISLNVFDAQGRLMATLVQGRFEAGSHTLSVFSDKVDPSASALVFKLNLGNQVRTHLWSGL